MSVETETIELELEQAAMQTRAADAKFKRLIRQAREKGMTLQQIADATGFPRETVRVWSFRRP